MEKEFYKMVNTYMLVYDGKAHPLLEIILILPVFKVIYTAHIKIPDVFHTILA